MRVFISYSKSGAEFADRLRNDLSQQGVNVVTDASAIRPGDAWAPQLTRAIKSSDAVITVVAPDSAASQWQAAEVALAVASLREGKRIIPVLATKHASMPYFLDQFQYVDLSDPVSYQRSLKRLIEALKIPAEPTQFSHELLRSQHQVLRAQQRVLKEAELEWQNKRIAKSGRLTMQFLVLLTVVAIATGLVLLIGPRERLIELGIIGNVVAIVSAIFGYIMGRRADWETRGANERARTLRR